MLRLVRGRCSRAWCARFSAARRWSASARPTTSRRSHVFFSLHMFDLTGKVALVTGASRGIGRVIAERLAGRGAAVVAAARGEHASATAQAIVERGGRAEAIGVDVTDRSALEQVPAHIVEKHGRLDIVVSNAGITRDQLLMRMKRDDWDAVIATNLTATFTLAQAAMRPMLKQRAGRIIQI